MSVRSQTPSSTFADSADCGTLTNRVEFPARHNAAHPVAPGPFVIHRSGHGHAPALDVAIAGGGPAGLYAAYKLASQGFSVQVFEEHPVPGMPVHCTGVFAADAFDEFDLPRDAILNELRTARFHGPAGDAIEYTTPTLEALVVDRSVFDKRLAEQATAAGAQIHCGVRVLDVHTTADKATLTLSSGIQVAARAVVLACGANYGVQRRLGLGMPSMHLQSAQLELPASRLGDVEVHFGSDVAPKGFAWVVPVQRASGTFARVGLMAEDGARECFDRFFTRVADRWGLDRTAADGTTLTPRLKMLPLAPIERTYHDRLLAVGDAAGLVKATTGGGIYYSVVSASIAADVLAHGLTQNTLDQASLAVYQERWRAVLAEEIEAQASLREIANTMSDTDIDDLFELAQTNGIMPIVRKTARFNRHRDLIKAVLNHAPARRLLMKRVLGWGRTA